MRVLVQKKPVSLILGWIQRALFAGAIVLLGYCGFVLIEARVFQHLENRELDKLIAASPAATTEVTLRAAIARPPRDVKSDGLIGRIEIPRLGVSSVVIEGTSGTTLRRAVGHIPGTASPGQQGNIGIAGHRDTFFRPLRNIRLDDVITLTTLSGTFHYRVVSTKVVNPFDVGVLDGSETEVLTLVTCYPFSFVGSAPDRFIVRAERFQPD